MENFLTTCPLLGVHSSFEKTIDTLKEKELIDEWDAGDIKIKALKVSPSLLNCDPAVWV